jgi:hypothetical protein
MHFHRHASRSYQHAGREVQRSGLTEQVPVQRPDDERVFEREDLDADELRADRVFDVESGYSEKKFLAEADVA